jgi:uncharacterized protein (TIGR00290 family)
MTSGGKDATIALDRARRDGLDVRYLATLYDASSERIRFHGLRRQLVADQARSLGLDAVLAPVPADGFESVFVHILGQLKDRGIEGIVFGNVHLADVRAWYEERVRAAGLDHVEPLWGEPGVEIAWEVVERGYRAVIVSVHLDHQAVPYLGREFDADVVTELSCQEFLDPCGERGEYHTFVFDGPAFERPIGFVRGTTSDAERHRYLDLLPLNGRSGQS